MNYLDYIVLLYFSFKDILLYKPISRNRRFPYARKPRHLYLSTLPFLDVLCDSGFRASFSFLLPPVWQVGENRGEFLRVIVVVVVAEDKSLKISGNS